MRTKDPNKDVKTKKTIYPTFANQISYNSRYLGQSSQATVSLNKKDFYLCHGNNKH